MDTDLHGRRVLIAGGTSGLGLGVAHAMLAEGASVAVCGRNEAKLKDALSALKADSGGEVFGSTADITSESSVREWVDRSVSAIGGIDIVVANSGGPTVGHATEHSIEEYRDAVDTNLLGLIRVCQSTVDALPDGRGRIVLVSSITAKDPVRTLRVNGQFRGLALSNSVRPAVLGFMKSLMYELGPRGITVNTLCPGFHETERAVGLLGRTEFDSLVEDQDIPLGRAGRVDEFASAAVFLASGAASYVNGCAIAVDGGVIGGLS